MSTAAGVRCAVLQRVTLGMVIRDGTVKYIEERRTKALSNSSELESLRFRSSLFTIFFEPLISDYQVKLYKTFYSLSIELLFGERMFVL